VLPLILYGGALNELSKSVDADSSNNIYVAATSPSNGGDFKIAGKVIGKSNSDPNFVNSVVFKVDRLTGSASWATQILSPDM
jgi:hypothetical protein